MWKNVRSLSLLLPLIALTSAALAGGQQPVTPAVTLRLGLPDGLTWTLGEGGIGRPYMVQFVLTNHFDTPITIWDYKNKEGAQTFGVILTDETGKEIVLRPLPIERKAGDPTIITIEPYRSIVAEFEMLRMVGEHGLPPGHYWLRGFYENEMKNEYKFLKADVWTGRLDSQQWLGTVGNVNSPAGGTLKADPRGTAITIVAPTAAVTPPATQAARTKTNEKGWELRVWQDKDQTFYSLMQGTNRLKTDEEITKSAVKTLDEFKKQLDEVKEGESLFFTGHPGTEPPQATTDAVIDYCKKIALQVCAAN